MIIGTAGHVDHGKSALVQALTGQAMDRLAEEKRRGITIELGFTAVELDGRQCGVVDVPGHEDFVRTMVAGASGIDLALLVVAADDGIMPQTREHLLVLEHLGVPAGIPVVTKSDLVEPDWLALVQDDVDAWLASSRVPFAPALAVSTRTGQGMDTLRTALAAAARGHPSAHAASSSDLFRLPVDRAFTVPGAGTVVTGTTWSGAARVGDEVEVWPGGHRARIRGIEVHGVAQAATQPGCRTACSLNGVAVHDVPRGAVLVHPDRAWRESSRLDVELELSLGAPPLRPGQQVWVHLGTASATAHVSLPATLAPGHRAVARLRLASSLLARGGDRFVLRSWSPVTVIGGGRVRDPQPVAARPASDWDSTPEARLLGLAVRRRWGVALDDLPVLAGTLPGVVPDGPGLTALAGRLLPAERVDTVSSAAVAAVAAHHDSHPTEPGLPLQSLRRRLAAPDLLADAIVQHLVQQGRLVLRADGAALPDFRPRPARSHDEVEQVRTLLAREGLTPRPVSELARELGFDPYPVLKALERAGDVAALGQDVFAAAASLQGFRAALEACGAVGPITPAAVRDRTGLTRKHLIPLLEWADRVGITVRHGDERRLRH